MNEALTCRQARQTEPYLGQLGDLLAHLQVQVLGIFHSDAGLEGHAAGC